MAIYLLGIHEVENYAAWYKIFSSPERIQARKAAGCLGGNLYEENRDEKVRAVALLEWDNKANLEKFLSQVSSPQFREVLRSATVKGKPQTHILEFKERNRY